MRAWLALLLVPISCSSSIPFPPSDDIAEPFDGNVPDHTLPTEGGTDAGPDVIFNGGGPFLCIDCTCDGTSNVCEVISGGKAPFDLDAGDAGEGGGMCDPDAGQTYCAAIPIECLPKPTCACVAQHFNPACTCDVDPSGNGLVISCLFP
jgi:hypothetical protein